MIDLPNISYPRLESLERFAVRGIQCQHCEKVAPCFKMDIAFQGVLDARQAIGNRK
jgi:hypothetical protein